MTRTLASLLLAGGLLAAGQAMAGGEDLSPAPAVNDGPLIWHNESLTYLWGKNFKVDPPIQQTFTFESASA
ncbi:nucleoside-specific outer membrane channel protein Tsx [Pseudomonas nitritireducens]|uniref:Nucleoside-specific outer membrane channel protein Tsx n=2 Tax=Pseudomonas TaxID=286 RepID=A0A7W7KGB1_PSENT|nr:nucleoside-specific outer membrane channel protein Tsx [Pseudomonas nitritireducens]